MERVRAGVGEDTETGSSGHSRTAAVELTVAVTAHTACTRYRHGGEVGHETPPLGTQILAAVSWWKRRSQFPLTYSP